MKDVSENAAMQTESKFIRFLKTVGQQIARLFGLKSNSKFVKKYINDVNIKSAVFMGVVIVILEIWLIARTFHKYIIPDPTPNKDFFFIMSYISLYILFLLIGLSISFYCVSVTNKTIKDKTKLILNLVFGGLTLVMCVYAFKENYVKYTPETAYKYYVNNILLIALYVTAALLAMTIILSSLLKFWKKNERHDYLAIIVIVLFAIMCLTFGIRVSYSDHARVYIPNKKTHNEIICFLTMVIYVACLLIWKPWISILVNVGVFVGFFYVITASNALLEGDNLAFAFSSGDTVNYITFFVSLTMVSIMMYHQRLNAAEKDESLERLANYDSLTGMHTTGYFVREVNEFTAVASNGEIEQKIALFINITDFKLFNDQRGFLAGNDFLTKVGRLIEEIFPNGVSCRQADDHYFVFTNNEGFMEKIEELDRKVRLLDEEIQPNIKVGGYRPTQKEEARRMVDKARYACSVINKNRNALYMEYDIEMHKRYHLMQYVIHNVDKAAENGWLQPYYQPVVYSESGELCGAEALVRWIDPEYGFLSPGMFVPTLESVKLIHKVDAYLVERVCQDIRKTMDAGLPAVPVSINFSRHDFECMDAIGHLEEMVKKYNIPKEMLHVEITESAMMDNVNVLLDASHKLKKAGYALWLDDFGSGYSSLNVLKDFEFDVMKIDMVFLKNFENSKKAKPLIESIVQMANKMGMRTLTEGVETDEQKSFLKSIKCERLQGYLFGKPISYDDFIAKVEKKEFKVSKKLI